MRIKPTSSPEPWPSPCTWPANPFLRLSPEYNNCATVLARVSILNFSCSPVLPGMLCPRVSSPPTPLHHPGLFLNLISPRRFSRKTALVSSSSSVLPYTWVRGLCLTLSPSNVNSTRARTPSPWHKQQASGTAADQGHRNHHSKAPCKWAGKSTGGLPHPGLALPVSCTPSCQPQHPQALIHTAGRSPQASLRAWTQATPLLVQHWPPASHPPPLL